MIRKALWPELAVPVGGLMVLVVAAVLAAPSLLASLSVIWFLPTLLRRLHWIEPLDERESEVNRLAHQASLSILLILVCWLPLLLSVRGADAVAALSAEWADVGFLVLTIFYLRAAILIHHAVPRSLAAHLAGSVATLTVICWTLGLTVAYPNKFPLWLVLVPVACLLPHLVACHTQAGAALLWLAGAALTALYVLTAGFTPLEQIITLGLLALPWALAACWIVGDNELTRGWLSDRPPLSS